MSVALLEGRRDGVAATRGSSSVSRSWTGASTVMVSPSGSSTRGSVVSVRTTAARPKASFHAWSRSQVVSSSPWTPPIGSSGDRSSAGTWPLRCSQPLNHTSAKVTGTGSAGSTRPVRTPPMWSVSTWVTTSSSNARWSSGSARNRSASARPVPEVPMSTSSWRPSPQRTQIASPWRASRKVSSTGPPVRSRAATESQSVTHEYAASRSSRSARSSVRSVSGQRRSRSVARARPSV